MQLDYDSLIEYILKSGDKDLWSLYNPLSYNKDIDRRRLLKFLKR